MEGSKEILASPRDWGSATKATGIRVVRNPQPYSTESIEIPSGYLKIFMAPTTYTIDFMIRI